jgi:Domain of unknown function (DUF4262)
VSGSPFSSISATAVWTASSASSRLASECPRCTVGNTSSKSNATVQSISYGTPARFGFVPPKNPVRPSLGGGRRGPSGLWASQLIRGDGSHRRRVERHRARAVNIHLVTHGLEPENDVQRRVVEDVQRVGWHSVSYGHGPSPTDPPFGHTIGLTETYGHPELIIVNIDDVRGHAIRRNLVECIEAGHSFEDGAVTDKALEDLDVRLRAVDVSAVADWLDLAVWFYSGHPFSALQVLWPDRSGRFPVEPGYDSQASQQLLLPTP